MGKRFVSVWFRHLSTDWFTLRQPQLNKVPFVLRTSVHGRMIIAAVNPAAASKDIQCGSVLADAVALNPGLRVDDYKPDLPEKLLRKIAEWCIRFSPVVAIDMPDGILIDADGCSHLWGGEEDYRNEISKRLGARGYHVRVAMADTAGTAWALARYGQVLMAAGQPSTEALLPLPPEALRLEDAVIGRLHKLGLHKIGQLLPMPSASLRRRFGQHFMMRLRQALGTEMEILEPVVPPEPYQERLICLEPISTVPGIEYAIHHLLEALCIRLKRDQKGLRKGILKGYRVDGKTEMISIETSRPSHHESHLFKLFQLKISAIEPALGIELFTLEAPNAEDHIALQNNLWEKNGGLDDVRLSELIDRLAGQFGVQSFHRFLPDQHYWPERSFRNVSFLGEKSDLLWRSDKVRPVTMLPVPEKIEVTAPIPDYPPMLFRYRGKLHKIIKADGPERIEQEWWIQQGQHRDYYRVEDEEGLRYWVFRLGHYDDKIYHWFIHGFFA